MTAPELAQHGMTPGTHERPGGPECRCGMPWDWWNERCLSMTTPPELTPDEIARHNAFFIAAELKDLEEPEHWMDQYGKGQNA